MYSTTPQISPPTCSTTTKHLPYLTISSFNLTDICGGNNNFSSLCGSDSSCSNNTKQNIINNNNINKSSNTSKVLNVDGLEVSRTHDSFNRSIYEYINGLENFNPSKILEKTPLKISEKISHQHLTKIQQHILKNGKPRHDV